MMPRTTKYLPAEERKAEIVEAVIDLAGKQNPSHITTSAIAERMGLTQGALFRHFSTKEAMLQAVMEWVSERLLSRVEMAASGASSCLEALERIFLAHIDFISEHPGIPRMLFGELQHAEETTPKRMVRIMVGRYGKRLREIFEQGKLHRELNSDLDVGAAATLFIGSVQGLVMQSLLEGDVTRIRREAPGVFAIYRQGIRNMS
jgi:AcrR family transcriptional regulator